MASLVGNLSELLCVSIDDPRCIVVIAEFDDHRYVQFWLDSWDYFAAEVISNRNIGRERALTDDQELSLRALGWNEPTTSRHPNWRREGTSIGSLVQIVQSIQHVVLDVLGESMSSPVHIRTFAIESERCSGPRTDDGSVRVYQREGSGHNWTTCVGMARPLLSPKRVT